MNMPPKVNTVIPPEGGWQERKCYEVEIAYSPNNPVHIAIFFSGFLEDGKPGGYNCVFNPDNELNASIDELYYLKVIRDLNVDFDKDLYDE